MKQKKCENVNAKKIKKEANHLKERKKGNEQVKQRVGKKID